MSKETEELLNKLESMEDAPLIWINQKVLNLYKENQQLKDMFEDSKTFSKQFLYKHNKNLLEANEKLQQQRDLYKEVIDEVREHIEKNLSFCENDSQGAYEVCAIRIASDKKLLQILDKAKDVK